MKYKIKCAKDTCLLSIEKDKNIGGQQIFRIQSFIDEKYQLNTTRCLYDFDLNNNQNYLKYKPKIDNLSLQLKYDRISFQTGEDIVLDLYKTTQSWQQGFGLQDYQDNIWYGGATWNYTKKNGYLWNGCTESIIAQNKIGSLPVSYKQQDFIIKFNNIPTSSAESGSFLIKFNQQQNFGSIYTYSSKTNTIKYPVVVLDINDYVYTTPTDTSSFSVIDMDKKYEVFINNMKYVYNKSQNVKFNISSQYIIYNKTFSSSFYNQLNHYMPSGSLYYRILDTTNSSREIFFDYDQYTRVNCKSDGNYFILNMSQFQKQRQYEIQLVAVNTLTDQIKVFSNRHYFTVK